MLKNLRWGKNWPGGEETDWLFFSPGEKPTSQFLPRGRNGPAWSFPGERLAGGKNWPLHRQTANIPNLTHINRQDPQHMATAHIRYEMHVSRLTHPKPSHLNWPTKPDSQVYKTEDVNRSDPTIKPKNYPKWWCQIAKTWSINNNFFICKLRQITYTVVEESPEGFLLSLWVHKIHILLTNKITTCDTNFLFHFQASFLNKKLNIGGKRVNLAIWVSEAFDILPEKSKSFIQQKNCCNYPKLRMW